MSETARCPLCKKLFSTGKSPAVPFCSERCRLLDLGNWLGESYRIPAAPDDSEGAPSEERDEE